MSNIETSAKALSTAEIASDHKAVHLRILDVSNHCDYADYFLFMSATSPRHAKALADAILEKFESRTQQPEGYSLGEWVLVDLGDIVVHIFHEPIREYYNLDKLWAHVPEVQPSALLPPRKKQARRPHSAM